MPRRQLWTCQVGAVPRRSEIGEPGDVWSRGLQPRRPIPWTGRREGRVRVPPRSLNFSGTPGHSSAGSGEGEQQGRGLSGDKDSAWGPWAWAGASRVFVRTRASHGSGSLVDLGSEASICRCLCVCVAWHDCLAPVSIPAPQPGAWLWGPVGAPRVSAYVVCACRRVWVGCPWGTCARSEPELPRLSASPDVHRFPPTWLQTFLRVPPATPAGSPPLSLSPPEVLRAARGWDRIGGSGVIGSPWRLARARIGRSVLDTLTGP